MNTIDVILILIVFFSVLSGFFKGFIYGIMDLVSWLGSIVLSFIAYPYVLSFAEGDTSSQNVWIVPLIFIFTFIFIRIIVGLVVNAMLRLVPKGAHSNFINKILGIVPGLFNGLFYAALIAVLLLILPLSDKLSTLARDSKVANKLSEPVMAIEEKLSPVIDEAVRKTIAHLTIEPKSEKFIKLPYTVQHPKPRPDLEKEMLRLVNIERTKIGLKLLKADPEMAVVARKHSADMFARGYFSHHTPEKKDPFYRMRRENVKFLTAGENLALARNLNMAHEGLMNSPGHRANILQPAYGRVGIGILDGGIYGIMVTQNFRN